MSDAERLENKLVEKCLWALENVDDWMGNYDFSSKQAGLAFRVNEGLTFLVTPAKVHFSFRNWWKIRKAIFWTRRRTDAIRAEEARQKADKKLSEFLGERPILAPASRRSLESYKLGNWMSD